MGRKPLPAAASRAGSKGTKHDIRTSEAHARVHEQNGRHRPGKPRHHHTGAGAAGPGLLHRRPRAGSLPPPPADHPADDPLRSGKPADLFAGSPGRHSPVPGNEQVHGRIAVAADRAFRASRISAAISAPISSTPGSTPWRSRESPARNVMIVIDGFTRGDLHRRMRPAIDRGLRPGAGDRRSVRPGGPRQEGDRLSDDRHRRLPHDLSAASTAIISIRPNPWTGPRGSSGPSRPAGRAWAPS